MLSGNTWFGGIDIIRCNRAKCFWEMPFWVEDQIRKIFFVVETNGQDHQRTLVGPRRGTPIPFWIFLAQLIALRHILFGKSRLFVKHATLFVIHCRTCSNQSLRKAPGRLPQHS